MIGTGYRGRQWTKTLTGVRPDHLQRYEFAAKWIRDHLIDKARIAHPRVFDAACGCGYGSAVLADAGCEVLGIDNDEGTVAFAEAHWGHPRATYRLGDVAAVQTPFHAVVSLETIEHIEHAAQVVAAFRSSARWLIASVPNEDVLPFRNHEYHFRHYRPEEFEELLDGYAVRERLTQQSKAPGLIEPGFDGRTLIVVAERNGNSPA